MFSIGQEEVDPQTKDICERMFAQVMSGKVDSDIALFFMNHYMIAGQALTLASLAIVANGMAQRDNDTAQSVFNDLMDAASAQVPIIELASVS